MKNLIHKAYQYLPLVTGLMVSRIIPHPANFTPLSAAALWSGSMLDSREAGVVILVAMIGSDILLGFDNLPSRMTVYGSLLLTVLVGKIILRKRSVGRVLAASAAATGSFFVLTNLSVWLFSGMYQHTLAGLTSCYVMALPFLRNSAAADIFFSGMFVGGWELVKKFRENRKYVGSVL